jgi:glutamyl-tRNA synthetase/glutamyl-Q tRNA(Asp) synthetase
MLPDEPTLVDDLLLGMLHQHPLRDHGDPVIRDAQEQWSYQFCVVIDDMADGVNLIVRGADLVASTGRQYLLARLLGRVAPFVTVHHPLLLDADGRKLSKRDGSSTIRSLREQGMTREAVLGLVGRPWLL